MLRAQLTAAAALLLLAPFAHGEPRVSPSPVADAAALVAELDSDLFSRALVGAARGLFAHPHVLRNDGTPSDLRARRVGRRNLAAAPPATGAVEAIVGVGGVDLKLATQDNSEQGTAELDLATGLQRRALNGSIIALGPAASTFVIPVAFGEPPVAFPLQLDTGSSDLLLASTECGSNCPLSATENPYYVAKAYSPTFMSINSNGTTFTTSYGDGTTASGVIARERVGLANMTIYGQVFGMVNATNLTLAEQKISGIMGLGFPRLSVLSRKLLHQSELAEAAASESATTHVAATSAATEVLDDVATTATQRDTISAYLPPLLESLVTTPDIPYPAFAIALSPPVNDTSSSTATASSAASTAMPRYSLNSGSLTLGGVSSQYVSDNTTSGRTVADIEWWHVVPFGPVNATSSAATVAAAEVATSSTAAAATSAAAVANGSPVPTTQAELENEQYLYWTVELANVAVNGTAVGLNSSYASIGLPSIAVLDVGTNGIYGPQQDVARIFSKITDARQVATGQWAVPCATEVTMGFTFGGRYVSLEPSQWMSAAIAGSSMCLAWPMAVEQSGDGIDWTLGTPFLRSVYTVFSYGINGVQAPLVGFLPLRDTDVPRDSNTAAVAVPVATPASLSATVATMLPNQLITGPNYPTATYAFETPPATGVLQTMGLGNASAYAVSSMPVVTLVTGANDSASSYVPGWPGGSSDRTANGAAGGFRVLLAVHAVLAVVGGAALWL